MSADTAETPDTRLVLVRHGESKVTVARVIGGPRTCNGLSELGIRQAQRLRDRLAETHEITADVLYSSAYPRARETAEIIAPSLGLEVRIEEGFGEHDPGPTADGVGFADFVAAHGRPNWAGDPHVPVFPDGETIAEFHHRVGSTLARVLARHVGETVVVSCHGGVVDVVMRRALHVPFTGNFDLWTKNTSLTEFSIPATGHWRLVRYNDIAHHAGLPDATPVDDAGD